MNKNKWKKWTSVVGRMLLAYALILAQGVWASQNQKTKDKADSLQKAAAQQAGEKPSSPAEPRTSSRGPHEGIKVHGHWSIEVRNPDGTVVSRREFENALSQDGTFMLAGLLSRAVSAGFWQVALTNPGGTQPCTNQSTAVECDILEPGLNAAPGVFPTLTTSLGTGAKVVLSGTATAANNTSISNVATYFFVCGNATAPSAPCNLTNVSRVPGQVSFNMTTAQVNPPIAVSTGQTIAATVIISFS